MFLWSRFESSTGRIQQLFRRALSSRVVTSDLLYDRKLNNLLAEREILDGDRWNSTKILEVGLCGAPNSGKSTLMNSLIGKKVSAVSHKVNTTRLDILGVKTIGDTQLIFHDTPGILQKSGSSKEEKELTGIAKNTLSKMDLYLTLIDGSIPLTYLSREVIHTAVALAQQNEAQILIALNKCDLMKPATLIQERKKLIVEEVPSLLRPSLGIKDDGSSIISLSALKGQGIKDILRILQAKARPGRWLFSPGVITNRSQEEQANEIIREKVFHFLNQEIPYELIVVHRGWKKLNGGLVLDAELLCQSPSQQRIVSKIRRQLEFAASDDISKLFGRPIRVTIQVGIDKS